MSWATTDTTARTKLTNMCFWTSREKRKLMAARMGLPDEEFCSQVGIAPIDWQLASAARRAIARCCEIPAESIRPEDIFEDLVVELVFPYWNRLSFVIALREETGLVFKRDKFILPELRRFKLCGRIARTGMRVDEWFRIAIPTIQNAIDTDYL